MARREDGRAIGLWRKGPLKSWRASLSESIHPDTDLGAVYLTVTSLDRSIAFYGRSLGFALHRRQGDTAHLGPGTPDGGNPAGTPILVLSGVSAS